MHKTLPLLWLIVLALVLLCARGAVWLVQAVARRIGTAWVRAFVGRSERNGVSAE